MKKTAVLSAVALAIGYRLRNLKLLNLNRLAKSDCT